MAKELTDSTKRQMRWTAGAFDAIGIIPGIGDIINWLGWLAMWLWLKSYGVKLISIKEIETGKRKLGKSLKVVAKFLGETFVEIFLAFFPGLSWAVWDGIKEYEEAQKKHLADLALLNWAQQGITTPSTTRPLYQRRFNQAPDREAGLQGEIRARPQFNERYKNSSYAKSQFNTSTKQINQNYHNVSPSTEEGMASKNLIEKYPSKHIAIFPGETLTRKEGLYTVESEESWEERKTDARKRTEANYRDSKLSSKDKERKEELRKKDRKVQETSKESSQYSIASGEARENRLKFEKEKEGLYGEKWKDNLTIKEQAEFKKLSENDKKLQSEKTRAEDKHWEALEDYRQTAKLSGFDNETLYEFQQEFREGELNRKEETREKLEEIDHIPTERPPIETRVAEIPSNYNLETFELIELQPSSPSQNSTSASDIQESEGQQNRSSNLDSEKSPITPTPQQNVSDGENREILDGSEHTEVLTQKPPEPSQPTQENTSRPTSQASHSSSNIPQVPQEIMRQKSVIHDELSEALLTPETGESLSNFVNEHPDRYPYIPPEKIQGILNETRGTIFGSPDQAALESIAQNPDQAAVLRMLLDHQISEQVGTESFENKKDTFLALGNFLNQAAGQSYGEFRTTYTLPENLS